MTPSSKRLQGESGKVSGLEVVRTSKGIVENQGVGNERARGPFSWMVLSERLPKAGLIDLLCKCPTGYLLHPLSGIFEMKRIPCSISSILRWKSPGGWLTYHGLCETFPSLTVKALWRGECLHPKQTWVYGVILILGLVEAAMGPYSFQIKLSEIRQWLWTLFP